MKKPVSSKLVILQDLVTEIDASLDWYALLVPPQKEYVAAHILRRLGYATFVPTETRWRFANRYSRARRNKEEMAFAVVPRYVFAGFNGVPPWYRLFQIPLVLSVVGFDGAPRTLDRTQFALFSGLHANGSLRAPVAQRHMPTHREFGIGDKVEIMDGPFREHQVRVDGIAGNMAKVLLPLFGFPREIAIPLEHLANVA